MLEGAAYSTVTWRSNEPSAESKKANAGFRSSGFGSAAPLRSIFHFATSGI